MYKKNCFEFDRSVYQQVSGAAIGTRFAPPYACIFMDRLENSILETQTLKPLVWLNYIDDIFLYGRLVEKKLNSFDTSLLMNIRIKEFHF